MRIDEAGGDDEPPRVDDFPRGQPCGAGIPDEDDSIAPDPEVDVARRPSGAIVDSAVPEQDVNAVCRVREDQQKNCKQEGHGRMSGGGG